MTHDEKVEAVEAGMEAGETPEATALRVGTSRRYVMELRRRIRLGRYSDNDGSDVYPVRQCPRCHLRDIQVGSKPIEPHVCIRDSIHAVSTRGLGRFPTF